MIRIQSHLTIPEGLGQNKIQRISPEQRIIWDNNLDFVEKHLTIQAISFRIVGDPVERYLRQ